MSHHHRRFLHTAVVVLQSDDGTSARSLYFPQPKPDSGAALLSVPLFCFPEVALQPGDEADELSCDGHVALPAADVASVRLHQFVLTNEIGDRLYCACLSAAVGALRSRRCLVLVSEWPAWSALYGSLKALWSAGNGVISEALEPHIWDLLRSVPPPLPHLGVAVQRFGVRIEVEPYSAPYAPAVSDSVFLFQQLSIRTVLSVFAALLTHTPVVFHSHDSGLLARCCEAMRALLFPFAWEDVYVPLVPMGMADILEAPTNFFLGALNTAVNAHVNEMGASIMRVCLDTDRIAHDPAVLPDMHRTVLTRALRAALFPTMFQHDAFAAPRASDTAEYVAQPSAARPQLVLLAYLALLLSGFAAFDRDRDSAGHHVGHDASHEDVDTLSERFDARSFVRHKAAGDARLDAFFQRLVSSIVFQRFVERVGELLPAPLGQSADFVALDTGFLTCLELARHVALDNAPAVSQYLQDAMAQLEAHLARRQRAPIALSLGGSEKQEESASDNLAPTALLASVNDALTHCTDAFERAHLLWLRGSLHWQLSERVAALCDWLAVHAAGLPDMALSRSFLFEHFAQLSAEEHIYVSLPADKALRALPFLERRAFLLGFAVEFAVHQHTLAGLGDASAGSSLLEAAAIRRRAMSRPAPLDRQVAFQRGGTPSESVMNLSSLQFSTLAARTVLGGTAARGTRINNARNTVRTINRIRRESAQKTSINLLEHVLNKQRPPPEPEAPEGPDERDVAADEANGVVSPPAALVKKSPVLSPLLLRSRNAELMIAQSVLLLKRQALLISTATSGVSRSGNVDFCITEASLLRRCKDHPSFADYATTAQQLMDMDVTVLGMRERVIFFLNVAAAMTIHAVMARGRPPCFFDRACDTMPSFRIGDEYITTDDIYYTILRLPPPPSSMLSASTGGRHLTIVLDDPVDAPDDGDDEAARLAAAAAASAAVVPTSAPAPPAATARRGSLAAERLPPARRASLAPPTSDSTLAAAPHRRASLQPIVTSRSIADLAAEAVTSPMAPPWPERDFVPRALHKLLHLCVLDCTRERPSIIAFDMEDFEEHVLEVATAYLDRCCEIDAACVTMPASIEWYCRDTHGSEAAMLEFFAEFLVMSRVAALVAEHGAPNVTVRYRTAIEPFCLSFDADQFFHPSG